RRPPRARGPRRFHRWRCGSRRRDARPRRAPRALRLPPLGRAGPRGDPRAPRAHALPRPRDASRGGDGRRAVHSPGARRRPDLERDGHVQVRGREYLGGGLGGPLRSHPQRQDCAGKAGARTAAMTTRVIVVAGVASGVGKTSITLGLLEALRARGLRVQAFKVGPDFIDPGFHALATGRPSYNLDGWMCGYRAVQACVARQSQDAHLAVAEGVMGCFDAIAATCRATPLGAVARDETLTLPERHLGLVTAAEGVLDAGKLRRLADAVERSVDLDRLLSLATPLAIGSGGGRLPGECSTEQR